MVDPMTPINLEMTMDRDPLIPPAIIGTVRKPHFHGGPAISTAFPGEAKPPPPLKGGGETKRGLMMKTLLLFLITTHPQQDFFITNESMINALYNSPINLSDPIQVFDYVFSHLNDTVQVFPTENYYYFSFFNAGRWIKGNIRLSVKERENGKVWFAYYLFSPYLLNEPPELNTHSKLLGQEDSVFVKKISPLSYSISFKNKVVVFKLNQLDQSPPKKIVLKPWEDYLFKTFDESGTPFLLIFNKRFNKFFWILDIERKIPYQLYPLPVKGSDPRLVYDPLSGFVYFREEPERYVLIAVNELNARQNTYFDGPFDQLADNFPNPKLKEYICQAYPQYCGKIDEYGHFLIGKIRVAITTYFTYVSLQEVVDRFKSISANGNDPEVVISDFISR
jgi:hypothetical protein